MSDEVEEIEVKKIVERNMAGFEEINELCEKQILANSIANGVLGGLGAGIGEVGKKVIEERNEFGAGVGDRHEIDKIINAALRPEHIVAEGPERLEFVEHDLYVPAEVVETQREKPDQVRGVVRFGGAPKR